jgi:hypothetical protein
MVKVKDSRPQRRAALMSLLMAISAAFITLIAWWVWRHEEEVFAKQRDVTNVVVTWECPSGYRFQAPGACSPRPCPDTDEHAEIVLTYRCSEHGPVEVYARYRPGPDHRAVLALIRYRNSESWQPADRGVHCPICRRRMVTDRPDSTPPKTKGR